MKRIQLFALFAVLVALASRALAGSADPGPVTFKITATSQAIDDQTTFKTNTASTSTNFTATSIFTESNSTIDNTALLQMLANSFNTTFPSGALLKYNATNNAFVVVNGTSQILNVSNVFTFGSSNNAVATGTVVTGVTFNSAGESTKTTQKFSQMASAGLAYDDSALTTANGNTTRLMMHGVESFKTSSVITTNVNFTDAVSFTGDGSGSISNSVTNTKFILRGGFTTAVGGTAPLIE
jgi:hypothetical protein